MTKEFLFLTLLISALPTFRSASQTPVTSFDPRLSPQATAPSVDPQNPGKPVPTTPTAAATAATVDSEAGSATKSSDYVLGPGDVLTLSDIDLDDVLAEKNFRVDNSGQVTLPLVGRVQAAGLSMSSLEGEINQRLAKFVKSPAVVVGIAEFHSQPVSVLGAVTNPGVHQLLGGSNLYTVLSLAGGLRPDAGSTIQITRSQKWGPIPLTDAKPDPTGQFTVASVNVKNVMSGTNPAENITIMPGDVISVPRADVVYAVGAVVKPGGFLVLGSDTLSALQVISLAEGLEKTAAPKKAMILRTASGSAARTEIPVNLKLVLAGKESDAVLQANDILFIPTSTAKIATKRTIDAVITAATGAAVYGRY